MNNIRKQGLIYLVIGLAITGLMISLANYFFGAGNWNFIGYGFAIPGALALVGLIQLVSGVPFNELASSWDNLAGWQRGILGLIIVLVACSIIVGCLILFAKTMYG